MQLNPNGRELYELQITTTASNGVPIPASGWEASFDGGTTWKPTTVIQHASEDWSTWLVAGESAALGTAVAVLKQSVKPLVRAIDSTEIVVRDAPEITVTGN